jgi:UDP-glucose 4-epimerase
MTRTVAHLQRSRGHPPLTDSSRSRSMSISSLHEEKVAVYLVTGGAGFIGSHITEELVRRGERVRVLDNLSSGREENLAAVQKQISFHKEDVRNLDRIRPAFQDADYVIHLAAIASVQASVEDPLTANAVNLTGTLNVLVAARDAQVKRLVVATSAAAYGENLVLPCLESQVPQPLSPYALTKLAAEYYGLIFYRLYELQTVALRYFNVFGPRQDPDSPYSGVLSRFMAALLRGVVPVIFGDGEQSRDFVYVANVVEATLRASTAPKAAGKVINIGTGRSYTLNETLALLNKILNIRVTPRHEPPRGGDVRESRADITLARQVLGYEPAVPFEEGLRRTLEWFRGTLK